MASGEDAGGRGQEGGISSWKKGGGIFIRDKPEELAIWRKLRDPNFWKEKPTMGNQIFRQLSGVSFEFRGKDGQTTIVGQRESEMESSSKSSTDSGTTGISGVSKDQDAVFGDGDKADPANGQKGPLFSSDTQEQLLANLDQVTKENEQVKGRLNLLTTEFAKVSKQIQHLKIERSSSQRETDKLKEKVAGLEEIRGKMGGELAELKEKVQRMEDSTIPPSVERRGRPSRAPERRTIQCELCPKRFSFTQSKNLHVQIMHQGRRWYCVYCSQQYSSPAAKHVHQKRCRVRMAGGAVVAGIGAGDVGALRRPKRRRIMMIQRMEAAEVQVEATESE